MVVRLVLEPREVALQRWLEAIPAMQALDLLLEVKAHRQVVAVMRESPNTAVPAVAARPRRLVPTRCKTAADQCTEPPGAAVAVG